jgi:hypothetical protein
MCHALCLVIMNEYSGSCVISVMLAAIEAADDMACSLTTSLPSLQGDQPSRQDVVAELFSKGKLVPMLVQNLQTLMARARAQLLRAPDAQLPEQGCYSYQQLVEQYVQTIQFLHEVHNPTMVPELGLLLWEQLVEQPVTSQDKACGLRFFLAGISRHNEQFISPSTAGQLLREKIMALDPATLQTDAYSCFFEYFRYAAVCNAIMACLNLLATD